MDCDFFFTVILQVYEIHLYNLMLGCSMHVM